MTLIVLLGQTCSGKSEMAADLAKLLGNTWVVNCDSRQVYRDLNIGTAKIEGAWEKHNGLTAFWYKGVPHFLIDCVDPAMQFSLADYLQDWCGLFSKELLPEYVILTGGTGLFARAVVGQYQLPHIKDEALERFEISKTRLQQMSLLELQVEYDKIYPTSSFNESDSKNARRLINAILRKDDTVFEAANLDYPAFDNTYVFGIQVDQKELQHRITVRVQERLERGLLKEVKHLEGSLGGQRLIDLGLEYRVCEYFLQHKISEDNLYDELVSQNIQYAKRQLTWLKKEELVWINGIEDVVKSIRR